MLRTATEWLINGTLHFITCFASKPQLVFRTLCSETRYYYHQIWVTDSGQLIGLIVVLKKRRGFSANPSRGRRKKITTQMGQAAFWEEIFVDLHSDPALNLLITDVYEQRRARGLALCPEVLVQSL